MLFFLPQAAPATLTLDLSKPGVAVSPMLYGHMTEEINYSYDGGLYGELVRNRAFRNDPQRPASWRRSARARPSPSKGPAARRPRCRCRCA